MAARLSTLALVFAMAGCGRVDFELRDGGGHGTRPPDGGATVPAFVQSMAGDTGASNVNLETFAAPITAGDLLVVAISYDFTANVSVASVDDSAGNTFQLLGPDDGNIDRQYIAYAIASSSSADAVTVTLDSTPNTSFVVRIHEYAGIDRSNPFDAHSTASIGVVGGNDNAVTMVTTSVRNELVFAYCVTVGGTTAAGTGFDARTTLDTDVTEDELAATAGVYAATATTTATWIISAATFRPAGS